jgi:hypothetical protein
LLTSACEAPEAGFDEEARFAGLSSSSSAYAIGIVSNEDGGVVYVCGTDDASRSRSEWLVLEPSGDITTKDGGEVRGEAVRSAGSIDGSVALADGTEVEFSLPLAESGNPALYSAVDAGCRTGVVTYGRGGESSAGTWCSSEGLYEQVTPIAPVAAQSLLVRIHSLPNRQVRVSAVDAALLR